MIRVRIPSSIVKIEITLEKWGMNYNVLNQILAHTITNGIFHRNFDSRLLKAYAKLNRLVEVPKIFDLMRIPDIGSWNSLQKLYLNNKLLAKSLKVFFNLVLSDSARPNSHSVVAALSACARGKDLANGRIIHGISYRYLHELTPNVNAALIDMYGKNGRIELGHCVFVRSNVKDVAIWTSLLNGYILNGDLEDAKKVFDEMPERNFVTWTAMIVGYVRKAKQIEAFELFAKMRHEDCNPTTFTIVTLLSGCSDIGALNLGSTIHGYVTKRDRFVTDVTVNNSLIDMYAKSGNLDSGMKLFDTMRGKDIFSWTTIISGLALNGRGKHALLVFDAMLESRMVPNKVTFLSILSACSHSGLVMEGERLFNKFVCSYGMKPQIEHFGCMVDLFVRAGCLGKAVRLVEMMPMKPDTVIWRSLLSGCLGQGSLELAELAGQKVVELEPDDDAVYVLLWSVYRSKNRWDNALRAMQIMRELRIKKTPGCSWIEVNGVVFEFLAEVSQQNVSDSIKIILNGMIEQSKLDNNHIFSEI